MNLSINLYSNILNIKLKCNLKIQHSSQKVILIKILTGKQVLFDTKYYSEVKLQS